MLQILELTKNNIVAAKAEDRLTENNTEKIHPLIHAILNRRMKVRWYFELKDFTGYDLKGLWEDLKVDAAHFDEYGKMAMVGEKW